jgi:hypothetical protein
MACAMTDPAKAASTAPAMIETFIEYLLPEMLPLRVMFFTGMPSGSRRLPSPFYTA